MNLVICLLVARHNVTKARIRGLVEDYRDLGTEAFEKMFERDKDELRDLGIPIEIGEVVGGFEDEVGYRIRRSEYELPSMRFTAEEAAVLGLAARVWEHASLAEPTSRALLKLEASGIDTDTTAFSALETRLPAGEAAFDPLWHAARSRTVVTFAYRRPGAVEAARRTLEPWGILNWRGRWYVAGHDRDRDATRMFRLSRIEGEVGLAGAPGAFTVPEGVDLRELAATIAPGEPRSIARIRVRDGAGHGLRRRASAAEPDGAGWQVLELGYADVESLADEVAGYGADAVVREPVQLRTAVMARLRAVLEGAPS